MNERRFFQLFFNKEQLSLSDMGGGEGSRHLREMKPKKASSERGRCIQRALTTTAPAARPRAAPHWRLQLRPGEFFPQILFQCEEDADTQARGELGGLLSEWSRA